MRAVELAIRLTVYYVVVTGVVLALVALFPDFRTYLPIGGAEALISGDFSNSDPFDAIEIGATGVRNFEDSVLWLAVAILGAIVTVLPMAWTYMAVRTSEEYDQSIVETIMVLPIAVTAIVLMVSHSIALAFGLAGIVGGVRFRNSLKSSGDAIYILVAIGIGLAAGIGALEIALIATLIYNYALVVLWLADFGMRKGAHRYMRRAFKRDKDDAPDAAPTPVLDARPAAPKNGKNGKAPKKVEPFSA